MSNPTTVAPHSLKTKVTLFTLAIFLLGIWTLAFCIKGMLREDIERLLEKQQFSTLSIVAAQANQEFRIRSVALKKAAERIAPALLSNPDTVETFFRDRPDLHGFFNGGVIVYGLDGNVIAIATGSEAQSGVNYFDRNHGVAALKSGNVEIGRPTMVSTSQSPIFAMSIAIRDAQGKVIGALAGITNLGMPNFLDRLTRIKNGESGSYLIVAPQHRMIVTATDKRRILEAFPAAGINLLVDRFMAGTDGSLVAADPLGVEVLASFKALPLSGWHMIAVLPTAEAFSPIHELQQRMWLITAFLTLLAGALIWWMLRQQLSPLLTTARALSRLSSTGQPPASLPIARNDEIGQLIGGFNQLLKVLGQREALLKQILDTSSVAIFLIDMEGRITQANQRMSEMFGIPLAVLVGNEYADLLPPLKREIGRQNMLNFLTGATPSLDLDRLYWRGDQTEFWGRLTCRYCNVATGEEPGFVCVIADITERKAHETQLEHIAHYDSLTTLPNRVLLADRLHQAMIQAHRRGKLLAVAYLDLDGFKGVNDTHGHEIGDQLLIALAQSMKQTLREGDTLARLGGDEFVAVLLDLPDVDASHTMLTRLLAAAARPIRLDAITLQVSSSVGVTFYPQVEEVDADQLLRQADQSMYQAKLAGKNRYHVFDADQDRNVRGHHESLEDIRRALGKHEFILHYQPKVNMRTGAVIGAEALIRWQHPERGLLPPAVFLPAIEDHPLAVLVGKWVINTALTQMDRWQAAGLNVPVSVNVGARQLQQADFVESLHEMLAAHPTIRPGDLSLEVLETSALEDLARVSQIIQACQDIGVTCALDDFGTGYSSLTYLKRLPVTHLKIDKSFVRNMLDDLDDLAILEGVISLAAAFRRQVIAEGVETVKHGEMLLHLGCELAQGFGISPPIPADDFPGWAISWRPDPAWCKPTSNNSGVLPLLFADAEHPI